MLSYFLAVLAACANAASSVLANPPAENPTSSEVVRDWIAARVAADPQMRTAQQKAQQKNS